MLLTARAASLLAATSLFLLQPLVARALVPLYGGTSWIWIAVSVFFQLSLILGYFAATKLSVRGPARLHARVAAVAMLFAGAGLWVLFKRVTFGGLPIEAAVFVHLSLTVGVVAVYLAMTSPLLQIAIAADGRIDAHRLYAWSNAGSLAGLILYPTVMESFVPLRYQMVIWLACAAAAAILIHLTLAYSASSAAPQPIEWRFAGRWRVMFISAVAGALTIAVTARLTVDLGALPLLWVLPLIALLLSYIVAFGNLRAQRSLAAAAPMGLTVACYVFFNNASLAALEMVILWCGLLFVVQCGLQTRLRVLAPSGGARGAYYVALAAGGFAGSLVVGCLIPYYWNTAAAIAAMPFAAPVLQPLLQTDPIPELGWCLVAAAFALVHHERWRPRELLVGAAIGIVAFLLILNDAGGVAWLNFTTAAAFIGAMALAYLPSLAGRPALFGVAIALIVLVNSFVPKSYGHELLRTRSVYGVLLTQESSDRAFTEMYHGTTLHGVQNSKHTDAGEVLPTSPLMPLTYYHVTSPIGEAFKELKATGCPLHVGIIGLGAGTLAAYARRGDDFEFYEIDPGVISAAEGRHFSFIAAARQRGARISIIEGDGRQTLARRTGPPLDLIVVDAFSSDSIPAHLLTLEAFQTLQRQLAPGGNLAFHVSNRYFAVDRVIAANADTLHWRHSFRRGTFDEILGTQPSSWVLARPAAQASGGCLVNLLANADPAGASPVWTDEFSNPLVLLKARGLWSQLTGRKQIEQQRKDLKHLPEGTPGDRKQSPGQP